MNNSDLFMIVAILVLFIIIGINSAYHMHRVSETNSEKLGFEIINIIAGFAILGIMLLYFCPQFINYIID